MNARRSTDVIGGAFVVPHTALGGARDTATPDRHTIDLGDRGGGWA